MHRDLGKVMCTIGNIQANIYQEAFGISFGRLNEFMLQAGREEKELET